MQVNDTLAMLKAAIAGAGNVNELAKATTFSQPSVATQGLQDYDLAAAVLQLYPVLTPLRNKIPRVGGGFGIQANWKAVTAIDTSNVFGGVSEGHRGEVIAVSTKEYLASYRTLGTEAAVTDEAQLAAADFDDVRARAAQSGLQSLFRIEEKVLLGGNSSYNLGVTPTPTLVAATTGGTLGSTLTISVICVALTFEGKTRASVATGVKHQVTRTTADGFVETIGGGSAQKSAAATVNTANTGTSSIVATVAPVRNAYGYAWYAGQAGSERLFAVTSISQVLLQSLRGDTQLATELNGAIDSSKNQLIHDGLLTMAGDISNGAYYKAAAPGAGLTPTGDGGIVEFDDMLQYFWDALRIAPSEIMISSQEALWIKKKIVGNAAQVSNARFTFNVQQGQIVGGGMATGYMNPFAMGNGPQTLPMSIHPDMPFGTVLFLTHELPYQVNNVDNILQVRTRKDYYQTDWPRRTRAYECGVYTDQVLQNKFMPGMGVITNLAAG